MIAQRPTTVAGKETLSLRPAAVSFPSSSLLRRRRLCVLCLRSKSLREFAMNAAGQLSRECRECAITGVRHLLAANRERLS